MSFLKKNDLFLQNVLSLDKELSLLNSEDLKIEFQSLRQKNLDDLSIIHRAFAITREISWRTLGQKHYPTQILGGLLLHKGQIIEMKTGEGKTLAATLAASLNALSGKGVHVVTVNEYLAKRDSIAMGKIYNSLGLSVGLIEEKLSSKRRRENYAADITYVTNTDLGFDFLRDNCVKNLKETVLRSFSYCIIDEVDSVLIDEARNPLIISDIEKAQSLKYQQADLVASCLLENSDFLLDQKLGQVSLTDQGLLKIESLLNIPDLYNIMDPWIPYIINALKANFLFRRNKEYVVLDGKICIVDEFTGRIMSDRQWSGGLHQAVEAKENLSIQPTTKTLASITYQNFFVKYAKISGMTGTAKTSENEFQSIYGLSVTVLPTAKPLQRQDLSDLIYRDELSKWKAVAQECLVNYQLGRPMLIGTVSVKNSEILSEILAELSIPHQLLNARPENIRRESEIVAQAGRKGAITIATNMAGRGTDIILGGNLKYLIIKQILAIYESGQFPTFTDQVLKNLFNECWSQLNYYQFSLATIRREILNLPEVKNTFVSKLLIPIYIKLHNLMYPIWLEENNSVKKLGGLYVLGTERHESSRIDNQLRGRAGRQGDPGVSRFFLSLEDELLRTFGGARLQNLMTKFNLEDDQPLESTFLTKSVSQAQGKVESFYYESRKRLFEYDEVLSFHRDFIYKERWGLLKKSFFADNILQYAEEFLLFDFLEGPFSLLEKQMGLQTCINSEITKEYFMRFTSSVFQSWLVEQLWISQDVTLLSRSTFGRWMVQTQRDFLLYVIDHAWMEHLESMDILRDSIGWKAYEQRDPLLIYKEESYRLFLKMIEEIRLEIVRCNLFTPIDMV